MEEGRPSHARRGFARAVLAVALAAAPLAASAEVATIETRGDWTLGFGSDVSGTRVCTASTTGARTYLGVKVYENSRHITVHLAKQGWRIPSGTRARLAFQFDGGAPWTGTGFSNNNNQVMETLIPIREIASFSNQFRYARRMRILFPDGNEAPWQVSMRGSRYIMDRLGQCVSLLAAAPRDTQPYPPGGGPAQPLPDGGTQPFPGAPPLPAPQPPAVGPDPVPPLPKGENV